MEPEGLEGTTSKLVELGDIPPAGPDELGRADDGVRGPVGVPDSLAGEDMMTTEVTVVVRSVICVVDTLVAMVVI